MWAGPTRPGTTEGGTVRRLGVGDLIAAVIIAVIGSAIITAVAFGH
ncbi:hypothetical protein SCATT_06100 [Streptantibioticus cattleyicolor NRRL 8057 = DSM 46488]|uniref:Uncharacterized protein n=1 Tax=Streptantibioticus cattleyicolor (strain ATCC 35852 / DSM 46488 / JCM 4925 / NBRC 14057 / NRRL 8057) TaxID=1003195 RepID=G8WT98_STREN|nr:hypothetical protein SCATT_06100 [Streptantibioticus cattleyicolor NRRL 8057 = DSM 46488]